MGGRETSALRQLAVNCVLWQLDPEESSGLRGKNGTDHDADFWLLWGMGKVTQLRGVAVVLLRLVAQREWLKRGAVQESQLSAGNDQHMPSFAGVCETFEFCVGCQDSGTTVNGTLCGTVLDAWQKPLRSPQQVGHRL
jgi:hypothetical protein